MKDINKIADIRQVAGHGWVWTGNTYNYYNYDSEKAAQEAAIEYYSKKQCPSSGASRL